MLAVGAGEGVGVFGYFCLFLRFSHFFSLFFSERPLDID